MIKRIIFFTWIAFLTSCGDNEFCNTFEDKFVRFDLEQKLVFRDRINMYEGTDGENFETFTTEQRIFKTSDPEDCPQVFEQILEYTTEDLSQNLFSQINVSADRQGVHTIEIILNSRSEVNNTNNAFILNYNMEGEFFAGEDATEIANYNLDGTEFLDVIEVKRSPRLPGSDLVEVIEMVFSLNFGIVKFVREDGITFQLEN